MLQNSQKIAVGELQIGMYVESLDRPWLETEFLFQGLRIDSEDDLARIRAAARYAYVSAADDELGGLDPQSEPAPVAPEMANDRRPRTFSEELGTARLIRDQAKIFVDTVEADLREGRTANLDGAEDIVGQMMASVARHPDALVWFTNLKNRDAYTAEHSMNVCMLAIGLATHIGDSDARIREMGVGALLHDVGKIRVPEQVLNKPGKLTESELAEMRRHPEYGYDILKSGSNLSADSLDVVLSHHERMNGTGYPRGLTGDRIGHYSQLVAIADVYDAITSNRVYQRGRSAAEALRIMQTSPGEFNDELLARFAENLGAYPPGSVVELNTGEVGLIMPNREDKPRPTVLIILDHKKRRYFPQRMRDLTRFPKFEIARVLPTGSHDVDVDYYAEGFE
ncbi:HD-GYP domain-containing protein [Salinisphaera sp. T31B1]|uniref:HD-GYP domain-containing protein n=1 Tax=Salinisphaera sp. T31B1 TaxID=727963 RepID=UPI003341CAC5